MSETAFGLNQIGQIHLSVSDIERSVAYYRDILGMRLLFEVPGQSMAFFDCGGVRLYLGKPESEAFRSSALIYYRVDDLDQACSVLKQRGAKLEAEPHLVHKTTQSALWMAALRDPDDHAVMLMCEKAIDGD